MSMNKVTRENYVEGQRQNPRKHLYLMEDKPVNEGRKSGKDEVIKGEGWRAFKQDGVFHFMVSSTTERSGKIRAEKLPLDLAIRR